MEYRYNIDGSVEFVAESAEPMVEQWWNESYMPEGQLEVEAAKQAFSTHIHAYFEPVHTDTQVSLATEWLKQYQSEVSTLIEDKVTQAAEAAKPKKTSAKSEA